MRIKEKYQNNTYLLLILKLKESELSLMSSYEEKNNFVINFIKENSNLKLDNCTFLDSDIYENIEKVWSQEMCENIFLLDSIYNAIRGNIEGKEWQFKKQNEEEYVVRRQASPPLEAYEYVPFNKMDIKPSKISHAALHNLI